MAVTEQGYHRDEKAELHELKAILKDVSNQNIGSFPKVFSSVTRERQL